MRHLHQDRDKAGHTDAKILLQDVEYFTDELDLIMSSFNFGTKTKKDVKSFLENFGPPEHWVKQ